MTRRILIALLIAVPCFTGTIALAGPADEQFCKAQNLKLPHGETWTGDRYFVAESVDISGRHDGDLIGGAQRMVIGGEVDGDVFLFANSVEISGTVRDSARIWASTVTVTGTIEGDLLVGAANILIGSSGHVQGNVRAFAGTLAVDGTVDGDLQFAGGKISLNGSVGRDADITADVITIDPSARVMGDFRYSARNELHDNEIQPVVQGQVVFEPPKEEEDDAEPWLTFSSALWTLWLVVSSMIVGSIGIGLFRGAMPALMRPIGSETLMGGLTGLAIFLLVPTASALAIVFIVSAPLGVIALVLFLLAIYLAKLPVALWLGHRLLTAVGNADPSPFLALFIGIVILYIVFSIPFYIGLLAWIAVAWLGLGAMALAARSYMQQREA